MILPSTIEDLQKALCSSPRVLPRGGGTKPALSTPPPGTPTLELGSLRGITAYNPAEFTFTALAGTPLQEVNELLAGHGQYLPFDPPFARRGATLGGTVAAGLSGAGRYQYGGVRDFLLWARYIDGEGRLICSGGQVVKNAAGFDLPKLMVGSLGRLGVLVELTFKVFPKPESFTSLRIDYPCIEDSLAALQKLAVSNLDLNAIEMMPVDEGAAHLAGASLWVRLAGLQSAMPARLDNLRTFLGGGESFDGMDGQGFWQEGSEFTWVPQGWGLAKVPVTPRRIPALDAGLHSQDCRRRYGGGGQVAWVALPGSFKALDGLLLSQGLSGLVLIGAGEPPRLGVKIGGVFAERVKGALDPTGRFLEV
jgi:glycolate oxidase FAD binding subunit